MKITKLGHCCLVIAEGGLKILTDPGDYTTAQNQVTGIDVILITHEHPDHLHIDSLKQVLKNNPQATIFTNHGVGKILDTEKVKYRLLEDKQSQTIKSTVIEGWGDKHAPIYAGIPSVVNTGYFISNRFFYPGDAFYIPSKPVEILALPVAAPWLKIADVLDYSKTIKPKICFPVHDGILKHLGPVHILPAKILSSLGTKFIDTVAEPTFEV